MYRIILWVLAGALLLALFSCAGSNDGKVRSGDSTGAARAGRPAGPVRLLLAASEARDSAAVVTEFHVDQALRAALDSIPDARYVTLNYRDSLADVFVKEGKKGIPLPELGSRLDLDGAIFTRIARFGSVLAAELRIVDPKSGALLFRDLSFSMIRFRDTSGTMFLGPTVYDVLRKAVARYFAVPHTPGRPVATEAMIVTGVTIPRDEALGQVRVQRQSISTEGVKALGEFARLHYPELVAFDYESRGALYRTMNIGAIDDFVPLEALERQAMFNVGIDRYVAASAELAGTDSMRVRLEIRHIQSKTADSLVDHEERTFPRTKFETTRTEVDFVVELINLAEPLFDREAERVRKAYEQYLGGAEGKR
jgi:hypothetical protein